MTEEQYQKLNRYLNDCFQALEVNDSFFLRNLKYICYISDCFIEKVGPLQLEDQSIQNHLSFQDVYLLAREMIEYINPSYLKQFDTILNDGTLDFGYEHEYYDSYYTFNSDIEQSEININREFHYGDVPALIHEFFHLLNGNVKDKSIYRYLFTEFISIYFEIQTISYLMDIKQIPKEEINVYDRILTTLKSCKIVNRYIMPFIFYEELGEVHPKNIALLQHEFSIPEKQYVQCCKDLLQHFERWDHEYNQSHLQDESVDYQSRNDYFAQFFHEYRYILGTLLAFYATQHISIPTMIAFNDQINAFKCTNIIDLLKQQLGIDMNVERFSDVCFTSMDAFIKKYGKKEKNK